MYRTKRGFLLGRTSMICFFALFLILSFTSAQETEAAKMKVEVNIFAPVIKISVPESVFLGNITKGYSTDRVRIDVNNSGTTGVILIPRLAEGSNSIFRNLLLARRTTEKFVQIGDFNMSISKPSSFGKTESDYFYIKLDLSDYEGEIRNDKIGEKADVIFWAIPT